MTALAGLSQVSRLALMRLCTSGGMRDAAPLFLNTISKFTRWSVRRSGVLYVSEYAALVSSFDLVFCPNSIDVAVST